MKLSPSNFDFDFERRTTRQQTGLASQNTPILAAFPLLFLFSPDLAYKPSVPDNSGQLRYTLPALKANPRLIKGKLIFWYQHLYTTSPHIQARIKIQNEHKAEKSINQYETDLYSFLTKVAHTYTTSLLHCSTVQAGASPPANIQFRPSWAAARDL